MLELLRVKSLHQLALVCGQAPELLVEALLSQRLVALKQAEGRILADLDFCAPQIAFQLLDVHCLANVDKRLPAELREHFALVLEQDVFAAREPLLCIACDCHVREVDEGVDEEDLKGQALPTYRHYQLCRRVLDRYSQSLLALRRNHVFVGDPLDELQEVELMACRLAELAEPRALLPDHACQVYQYELFGL